MNLFPTLDASPLPSDFETFDALLVDIQDFIATHPEHRVITADDPGYNYTPPRVPRVGWTAYLDNPSDGDEQMRSWTLPLAKLVGSKVPEQFKSSMGRQAFAITLTETD